MNVAWTRGTAAIAALALVGACNGHGAGPDAETDAETDSAVSCDADPGEEVDLLGFWGARAWIRVEVVTSPEGVVRMCPDPHPGVAVLTLLIHLREKEDERIDFDFVMCDLDMPRVTAALAPCEMEEWVHVQLELGPALQDHILTQEFSSHAIVGGDTACSSYVAEAFTITYGYEPEFVPEEDPLPGWDLGCSGSTAEICVSEWEHVIDEDGDGHPGVSLQVTTEPVDTIRGQAYTTWRTNPHMHGTVWSSSLIQGALSPTMEYDIVGSGADMQGLPMDEPTVKRNIPSFGIPSEGSTFRMVRIDGLYASDDLDADGDGSLDCGELLAHPEIFE